MGYNLLGRITWWAGMWLLRKKAGENRAKLAAAGVVALVLVGGVIAARASSGDEG